MQHFWLNKNNNKKLIVFFNGWGMNETPIKHLACVNYDILVLSDYRNFNFDFLQFDFSSYKEKYLICWSMGVYVSNLFEKELRDFDKKIAINGTSKMINNDFGIPEKIYKITIKLFDKTSCEKFIKNMFKYEKNNPQISITKTLEELKEELISIQNIELSDKLDFDLAIISSDDKIVPTKNQINFWQNKATIKQISSAHCPFDNFKSWSELLC